MNYFKTASVILWFVSNSLWADLIISQGWVKNAPPVVPARAAYMVMQNTGDAPVVIKSLSSTQFVSAELHETKNINGVYSMSEIKQLHIPAHGKVELKPLGKHIMLMMPKQSLMGVTSIDLTIETNEAKQQVSLPVKDTL